MQMMLNNHGIARKEKSLILDGFNEKFNQLTGKYEGVLGKISSIEE
jgi:HAE1 family hydrophobic/amphiphilic exporter-1